MFDSGITVSALIDELKNEIDIALLIPDSSYIAWINSVEQLLYSEIIKEQAESEYTSLSDINENKPSDNDTIRFEDIYTVYINGKQLIKTNLASGMIFPDTWYKKDNELYINTDNTINSAKIIYFARPKPKTGNGLTDLNIMLPLEFTELIKSKVRGEAYKLANEDSLSAKWLNEYNMLLENFKMWIALRNPQFGM